MTHHVRLVKDSTSALTRECKMHGIDPASLSRALFDDTSRKCPDSGGGARNTSPDCQLPRLRDSHGGYAALLHMKAWCIWRTP